MGGIALALGGLTALIGTIGGLALKIGAWVITRPFVWLYKLGDLIELTQSQNYQAPVAKPGTTPKAGTVQDLNRVELLLMAMCESKANSIR